MKELNIQVYKASRTPYYLNTKRPPRYIILKLSKVNDKERILKAAGEKKTAIYKGTPMRLSADFSGETLQARKEWNDIFKVLREKNCRSRLLLCPAKLSFRCEGEMKALPDKQKLREFTSH